MRLLLSDDSYDMMSSSNPQSTSCCDDFLRTYKKEYFDSDDCGTTMKRVRSVDFGVLAMCKTRGGIGEARTSAKASLFGIRASKDLDSLHSADQNIYRSLCKGQSNDDVKAIRTALRNSSRSGAARLLDTQETNTMPTDEATFMMKMPYGTLNIGKLSVVVLLLATVIDFCVCQVHRIESHDIYDALSAEVIRPPLAYKRMASHHTRPRASLGSAAISSVTETLSPILPFTGGLDLRREDYWQVPGSWFGKISSVAAQVRDAFSQDETDVSISDTDSIPRGGGSVPGQFSSKFSKGNKRHYAPIIAAQKPFISTGEIAEMTLGDVSETFRYATECNRQGFNEGRFLNGVVPRVRKVVLAMKEAAAKSRGSGVQLSQAKPDTVGDVDLLTLSAALRIFGEWRILRQVPVGYKGYAVGMNLGYKDIVQNLAKIEEGAHTYIDHHRDLHSSEGGNFVLRSPTAREVLTFERDMEINPVSKLPRLTEKSAAMGLLWVRRQLQYQTLIFKNVDKIPSIFPAAVDAVSAAYKEVYGKYHGWAVQKIFNYSFSAAPEAGAIFRHMNPHRLEEVKQEAQKLRSSVEHTTKDAWQSPSDDHIMKEENPVVAFFQNIGSEWGKIANHVGSEWDKLASNVVKFIPGNKGCLIGVRGGNATLYGPSQDEIESFITEEMTKDAHQLIKRYVEVALPLLVDVTALFDELNMDDPTKV